MFDRNPKDTTKNLKINTKFVDEINQTKPPKLTNDLVTPLTGVFLLLSYILS
jgi:hypothetical protein